MISTVVCPECGSNKSWKDGIRTTKYGIVQRYVCRECSYRFSDTNLSQSAMPEPLQHFCRLPLNMPSSSLSKCQIGVSQPKAAKNLVRAETKQEALRESDTKGQIVNFAWHLKKLGRTDETIRTYTKYVEILSKYGDINNPENIKGVIATHFKNKTTKRLVCCSYDAFTEFNGLLWEKPHYKAEHKQVFIPTEQELSIIINNGRKDIFAFSLFLYETGARFNEAERLEWADINHERKQITIKSSKNGKARTIPVSKKLIELLQSLPKIENQKNVFPKRARNSRRTSFRRKMMNLAMIHNNPRLLEIHFHTFRHCKALREYHKTKSMQHVKRILGHSSIMTTQRYVELYEELYDNKPIEYICEIATNIHEAKKLLEQGFRYETGEYTDGGKLFRKAK
jgi:integrase